MAKHRKKCPGFMWVGQSWEHCEDCGEPYWEHDHDQRLRRGAGPFKKDCWEYVLIPDEAKTKMKARYRGVT